MILALRHEINFKISFNDSTERGEIKTARKKRKGKCQRNFRKKIKLIL